MDVINWLISAPLVCIGWIIVGIVAGALARRLTGAADYPFWQDFLLGILGAVVGGFLASLVGGLLDVNVYARAESGLPLLIVNLLVATFGAAVLILLRRTITGRR